MKKVSASSKFGDRLIAAGQVAGVLATAWLVWEHAVLPQLGLRPVAAIVSEAVFYVAAAWMCGALTTFCVYMVISLADLPSALRFSFRSSTAAMWFAPAIVLLSAPLPAAFVVSLFLIANATRHLISQWAAVELPIEWRAPARPVPAYPFRVAAPDAGFLWWHSAPVLMASLAAQAGLVELLWRHRLPAAALFALSTAILTSLSISTGAYRPGKPPALPHSSLSVVLTFLLAAALTFGGISVRGRGGAGPDASSPSPDAGGQAGAARVNDPNAPPDDGAGVGGDFPGVILLPPVKPNVTLLVPVPATVSLFGAPLTKPVGVPFSGQYWMFRFPQLRPPRHSIVRRGNASELSFHTTDGWPMQMEAHQKLDPPVSVRCCSGIELVVRNADPYPGTVALELVLIDSTIPINPTSEFGNGGCRISIAVRAGAEFSYATSFGVKQIR